jgi:hypothetical protein
VLAEYNGGPVNAGYFRAGVSQLAAETRNYVPQVLELYGRLKGQFESGMEIQVESMHRDARRDGKTLAGAPSSGSPEPTAAPAEGSYSPGPQSAG